MIEQTWLRGALKEARRDSARYDLFLESVREIRKTSRATPGIQRALEEAHEEIRAYKEIMETGAYQLPLNEQK